MKPRAVNAVGHADEDDGGLAVHGHERAGVKFDATKIVAQLLQFRRRGQRRFEHPLLGQGAGPHPEIRFGGEAQDIHRSDAGDFFELGRQRADELQRGGIENAVRAAGLDENDHLVMDAEARAHRRVHDRLRGRRRDQRLAVRAQFETDDSGPNRQGDQRCEHQHPPGMMDRKT